MSSTQIPNTELMVSTGYGSLACKVWGQNSPSTHKFLAVHGHMDNASSFDPLMEYFMTKDRCVVCPDLPGHGLSSHLPSGIPYNMSVYIQAIRLVVKHLGWTSYNLIGHSLGGYKTHLYAMCWPEGIQAILNFDGRVFGLETVMSSGSEVYTAVGDQMDQFIDSKYFNGLIRPPRSFTWSELCKRWLRSVPGFTEQDLSVLMRRGAKRVGEDNYILRSDPALPLPSDPILMQTNEIVLDGMESLQDTALLMIRTSAYKLSFPSHNSSEEDTFMKTLIARNPGKVKVDVIDGEHHFHMQQPQLVSRLMNEFLSTQTQTSSKL